MFATNDRLLNCVRERQHTQVTGVQTYVLEIKLAVSQLLVSYIYVLNI